MANLVTLCFQNVVDNLSFQISVPSTRWTPNEPTEQILHSADQFREDESCNAKCLGEYTDDSCCSDCREEQ